MNKVSLKNISKRYNRNWVFKNINYEFRSGNAYVILGANGSGKSTLLKLISGSLSASEGSIAYQDSTGTIPAEDIYSRLSMVAPYLDLIEAYTLEELIAFHFQFKKFSPGLSAGAIADMIQLDDSKQKRLSEFSSGMRQRVKLALAILNDSTLLLLDEPTSNLDKSGTDWYNQLMDKYRRDKLVIVCSNRQKEEYNFCDKELLIEDFKKI